MTAATGSEIPIDPPALEEPVTGLIAQLGTITGPEEDRWLAGLSVVPEATGAPGFAEMCSSTTLPATVARLAPRRIQPFMVNVGDTCSTWAYTAANYEERARRALAVKRHWAVEREFERGAIVGANMSLAETLTDPATVNLAAGANVSPSDGLALLDESIGNSPAVFGRGNIYCTPFVGAKWKGAGLLEYENIDDDAGVGSRATILSPAGNRVIICGGMEGRGTDGAVVASHASQWAYCTDPIAIVASGAEIFPKTFAEATDKGHNTVEFRQQQWFAILWAGMHHAGVKISTVTPAL